MSDQVQILVRNGQYKNLVRDILLSHGLQLMDEVVTHGGREITLRIPMSVLAPKVDHG